QPDVGVATEPCHRTAAHAVAQHPLFAGARLQKVSRTAAAGLSGQGIINGPALRLEQRIIDRFDEGTVPQEMVCAPAALTHRAGRCRIQMNVSHSAWSSLLPPIRSKKRLCSCSVIGPRLPLPMARSSSSRMGMTSAAVPVKKA